MEMSKEILKMKKVHEGKILSKAPQEDMTSAEVWIFAER